MIPLLAETALTSAGEILVGSTGAAGLLFFALKWMNRDRDKLLGSLNLERDSRIKLLEESSQRCAEDRIEMRREISKLQDEVRDLLRSMIQTK